MRHVVVLMLAPFAFATGAYVFAGILEPMSQDLGVSVAATAQLQTAFTIACAIGGPLLALLTTGVDRRRLLLIVLVLLASINAASALAPDFGTLLIVRIAAGFVGALTLPVASSMAAMLVPPDKRVIAFAAILAGNSLAFLFGIPIGSLIGATFGWAASFMFSTVLCSVVAILIYFTVPTVQTSADLPKGAIKSVLRWPLTGLMGVTLAAFTATFSTIGLVGPTVTVATGLTGASIAWMQALIGIGSVAGLAIGAALARAVDRPLTILLLGILATQLLYSYAVQLSAIGFIGIVLTTFAIGVGAICLFACAPVIQMQLAHAAGPAATLAFALNGSMIFLGQGVGTAIGGLATVTFGLGSVGVAGAVVAALGILLTTRLLYVQSLSK
ncbi:MFS transporter [Litoreibacter roseus]|uniref:MFS transporter n=1 Tax=Litoreibacter roseus TaxID=2601869 RepID=A0A6N6JLP9_9RHOB|nr:MFS transporter [Litoreibacter roseus]GFE67005.1 MFS transporter [Litoreibacter roseus]